MRAAAMLGCLMSFTAFGQVELTPLGCSEETKLRDTAGETAATIEFVNATGDGLNAYRIDREGKRVFDFRLEARSRVLKNTFVAQPWVIADAADNCLGVYLPSVEASIVRIAPLSIVLPRTGLIFNAVEGGPPPAPRRFEIGNGGLGEMEWTLSVPMMSGSMIRGWASLSRLSGISEAGKPPERVDVTVDPWGLEPGEYCNLVEVSARGAVNSPQNFCVIMLVHPAETDLGPQLDTTGMLFVSRPGGQNPDPQAVTVTNANAAPMPLRVEIEYPGTADWLGIELKKEFVESGEAVEVDLRPDFARLGAGSHSAVLRFRFSEEGPQALVQVGASVPTAATRNSRGDPTKARLADETCTPTKLLPLFTLLGPNFVTQAGWPVPIEVIVADDCAQPMLNGSVVATFSNNDPPLYLTPMSGARWGGTWPARGVQPAGMKITATARQPERGLEGTVAIEGGVREPNDIPFVPVGGVVSAASLESSPVAPGSFVSIRGERLSEGDETATQPPLLSRMQGTEVFVSGRTIPLMSTSKEHLKAFIPYGVAVNGRHQMIVRRGHCMSVPVPLEAAEAQPAIFTLDGSGKGPGKIFILKPDDQQVQASPEDPVSAGDTIVIHAAGLGMVDAAMDVGQECPASMEVRTLNPVAVTVGGKEAVVKFAGLLPGMTGLYQVVAALPEGIEPGNEVTITLTVGGRTSPPATLPVK